MTAMAMETGGTPDRWFKLYEHEQQQQLLASTARIVSVVAGRGSGKSEIAKRKLILHAPIPKPWKDPRYFYAAPTRDQVKELAWEDLKALTPPSWMAREPSEGSLTIYFRWGSVIRLIGLDKPARIEGVQYDGGVLDESCDTKPDAYRLSIIPALRWRNGWVWRMGVPKRKGVGAKEFREFEKKCRERMRNGDPSYASFHWKSKEIVPAAALEEARHLLDERDYREQFDAEWVTDSGGIFYAFDSDKNVRSIKYNSARPILVGCDFNVDPMAWCLCHATDNEIGWFDELYLRDANTPHALDVLWSKYPKHSGGWIFIGDASGASRHSSASLSDVALIYNDKRFQQAGRRVSFPPSNPAVNDRFAACNAMFCNAVGARRMFIDPDGCPNLIDDVQHRVSNPGKKMPHDMGHITDAMGYVVAQLFPVDVEWERPAAVASTVLAQW